ncbi:MAG: type II toxin-antitoxin system HicB family antitoxin [Proteobacteria bacterium]|nr:type II toxin-antitoxin system HicB family antitoxin [Pseudomonadota bacterium]
MRYRVILPKSVGVPAATTREEVVKLMDEAIEEHIPVLREGGMTVPVPHSTEEYAEDEAA